MDVGVWKQHEVWVEIGRCQCLDGMEEECEEEEGQKAEAEGRETSRRPWTVGKDEGEGPGAAPALSSLLLPLQVLGALFLAIGLWAWGEKGVLSNISALTDLGGLDPVWLFVVVGGVMSVLGFAGCIGALRENTFLLKFFSMFLGLIFFLELATGILAFVFKDWIRDQLNLFINNNVKAYRDDIDLQNLIDFAQEYVSPVSILGHL
ncbi:Tetraspanin-17 [Saguinus oedipus]|uniref:Tetraspanin-17 n=1 Tax=Saguinus oedipus TaxID=9490 RepID=A0ABQ9WAI6_SAGOE|nr:Tetraspanin-17 [Saguinus oedipus]